MKTRKTPSTLYKSITCKILLGQSVGRKITIERRERSLERESFSPMSDGKCNDFNLTKGVIGEMASNNGLAFPGLSTSLPWIRR